MFALLRPTLFSILAIWSALALAQSNASSSTSVALSGVIGGKAILIVGGSAPKTLAAGETHQGVKLLSASGDQAVVQVDGKRQNLRLGDAPVSVGAGAGSSARGTRITLTAGSGGHFLTPGTINGRTVQFMVDTGATTIAMSVLEAERMGLKYQNGTPVRMGTANGVTQGYKLALDSVRVGEVEVFGVEAVVTPQPMPFVLLGNSFLNRFQMKRENEIMTLEKRF
jgi:aspartyl protease family protein